MRVRVRVLDRQAETAPPSSLLLGRTAVTLTSLEWRPDVGTVVATEGPVVLQRVSATAGLPNAAAPVILFFGIAALGTVVRPVVVEVVALLLAPLVLLLLLWLLHMLLLALLNELLLPL